MDWRDLYFSVSGRIDLKRYWLASLPLIGAQIVAEILIGSADEPGLLALGALLWLGVVILGVVITIKRLHDRNRSGWFMLVTLLPLLGAIWLLIEVGFLPGARGPNRFGPDPLEPTGAGSATSATAPV
jgi:uncharacterized membrane protein YhaH (DUF805 family)